MSTNRLQVAVGFTRTVSFLTRSKAILAGGCARDVYFGREPKDFDIIVPESANIESLLGAFCHSRLSFKELHFYRGDLSNDRIISCIKVNYLGVDFDILKYQVTDVMEASKFFDFNLNQFILNEYGDPIFVGEVHPNYSLIEIRNDASQKRKDYIQEKYREIYGTH